MIDQAGVPTPTWSQFRGANHKEILGQAIRDGYSELYAVYPKAHEHPNSDLENVFSTSTKGGRQVISKIVSTFRGLADQAAFDAADAENLNIKADALHVPVGQAPLKSADALTGAPRPSLHIDLQVHISPDSTPEQIEQIFASMAKHLYGK